MSIPCKMRPVGLESLPLGYTRLEFLECTGEQYCGDTGIYPEMLSTITRFEVAYNGVQCSVISTYANNPTEAYYIDCHTRVRGQVYKDSTIYTVSRLLNIGDIAEVEINAEQDFIRVNNSKEYFTNLAKGFKNPRLSIGLFTQAPGINRSINMRGKCYFVKMAREGKAVANYIPSLDTAGRPCMFDMVTRKPFYNAGTGSDFIAGFTMAQALNLAYLPANTTLTVSLPWEASLVQHNDEVEAAMDEAEENGCVLTTQYREPEKDSAIYNKYAECTNADDIAAVNADYKTDLTIDGAWEYALPKLARASYSFRNAPVVRFEVALPELTNGYCMFQTSALRRFKSDLPKLTNGDAMFQEAVESFEGTLPELSTGRYMFQYCKFTAWTVALPKLKIGEGMFDSTPLTSWGVALPELTNGKYMYGSTPLTEWSVELPKLTYGTGMFYGCQLTKLSVLTILDSIPSWDDGETHALTLGIHIDYQNDEEVLAAIALADIAQTPVADGGKGWTLTIQWNGTPTAQTASTFGLRKPPIYAKLDTLERPDGTTENFLDWGHYVSNAEENGYQEFASIEEAEEYFNITKATEES